jgi:hypothetical protein
MNNVIVEYVTTDVSFALANSAATSASYKYARAKTYDLTKHPKSQGFKPGSFDMVVGLHILNATTGKDILSAISFLRQLLVGGGTLLVVELDKDRWHTPGCLWNDFVFGSFTEWFDFIVKRTDHYVLLPEEWDSALRSTGYDAVQMSRSTGGGTDFLFTARKFPFDDVTNSPRMDLPSPVFLTYQYGHEMELRREISRLDVNQHLPLWLLTAEGVDGAAGMGLVQTLIMEFTIWDIHLAIFESTPDETDRIDLVLRHQEYLDDETAVRFSKDGLPHVFKVVPSPAPVSKQVGWTDKNLGVIPPSLQEYQVAVHVTSWSGMFSSWKGFVGYISHTKDDGFSIGDLVLGVIADAPVSNRIVCHAGQLTLIPSEIRTAGIVEYALVMVIAAIALGPSRISRVGPHRAPVRILLAARDEFSQTLHDFLKLLEPLSHVESDRPTSDARFDWIIVDSSTALQRPEVAFWRGKMLLWDKVMRDMCQTDPSSLGYSLQTVLQFVAPLLSLASIQSHSICSQDQVSTMDSEVSDPVSNLLFDRNKSYILLGGVSDLGIHIALWMYEVSKRSTCRQLFLTLCRSMVHDISSSLHVGGGCFSKKVQLFQQNKGYLIWKVAMIWSCV